MFEKLRFLSWTFIAIGVFLGFPFYAGYRMYMGDKMAGGRGIMKIISETLNALAESLGPEMAGLMLMGVSIAVAVVAVVFFWRNY